MDHIANPDSATVSAEQVRQALEQLPSRGHLQDGDAEAIYGLAYQSLAQARYDEALRYFGLLTLYRPTHPAYLRGLASAYRRLERYDEAVATYAFLAAVDAGDLQHSLDLVECLLLSKQYDDARALADLALQSAAAASVPARLRDRAEALKELLEPAARAAGA